MKTVARYHTVLVMLHWLLAIAILASLGYGFFVLGRTPNTDAAKVDLLRPHMAIGMAIGALTVVRLIVRAVTIKPSAIVSSSAAEAKLAGVVHVALYVAVLGMVASGFALGLAAGLPDIVFARSGAALPADFGRYTAKLVHGAFGLALVALLALHIGAAGLHQFVRGDGVMRRMGLGARVGKD